MSLCPLGEELREAVEGIYPGLVGGDYWLGMTIPERANWGALVREHRSRGAYRRALDDYCDHLRTCIMCACTGIE